MPHIEEYFVSRVARRIEFFRGLLKSEIQTSDEATDLPLLPLDRPPLDCWPADLFMAAFPRVRMNPGFEPLCLFTHKDMNRSSRLAAYQLSKAPLKAHDAIVCDSDMEEGLEEYRANAGEFCGGLAERIPVLPACRDSWAQRVCDNDQPEGIPPWLHWDINSCVNDDGTAKGLFERAMLAMCSCSPVNLWHAAGFTADCVVVSGDGWSDILRSRPENMQDWDGTKWAPIPTNWLPEARFQISPNETGDFSPPKEVRQRADGEPLNALRMYIGTYMVQAMLYETTVWFGSGFAMVTSRTMAVGREGPIP